MLSKLKKFQSLSSSEKNLFIEAYVMLGIMRVAISTISFKRLTSSLLKSADCHLNKLDNTQLVLAQAIGKSVLSAANNTPWESACLVQVLAAQRMLKRRGVGGMIHLGATMDKSAEENIRAHAWLKCGDEFITGEDGYESFRVLVCLSWPSGV